MRYQPQFKHKTARLMQPPKRPGLILERLTGQGLQRNIVAAGMG
jgi:hypothetical protein